MDKKKIIIGVVAFVVGVVAAGITVVVMQFSTKSPDKNMGYTVSAPVLYELDGSSVKAFPVGENADVSIEFSERKKINAESKLGKENEEGEESSSKSAVSTIAKTYYYAQVPDLAASVAAYANMLTDEDSGFVPVDEENFKIELPNFTNPIGSVRLVRPIEHEGENPSNLLFTMEMNWQEDQLDVTLAQKEGHIAKKSEKETPQSPSMTYTQAVDYFYSLNPSELGLNGKSMQEYDVFVLDGAVLVGSSPCMRVNVYQTDPQTNTNEIVGTYLFSGADRLVYQIGKGNQIMLVK